MTTRLVRIAVFGAVFGAVPGIVGLGTTAYAQTSPPNEAQGLASRYVDSVGGLDLDRAIARALEHEPSVRAVRADVDAARGMRIQAGLRPNPTISFSQLEEPAGMDNQTRVEVVWPLDLFRKTGRVRVAEREIEVTKYDVADRERQLAADVRAKYGEVAAAVRELTVLDSLFAAVSRQHGLVAARVEQGATPPLERDMLRVELQRLESERLLQSGAVERSIAELQRLLGMHAGTPLRIRDTLEQLVQREAGVPLAADSPAVVDQRADVQAVESRVQVADAQIERARREGRVDVSLFGMYMRMDAGFSQRAFGGEGMLEPIRGLFHYVAAGVSVTMPILNRNQGEVAAAQARRTGASAQLEATRLTVHTEIAAARARDERARQAVAIYTSDARALAAQNLTVVGQTYELGRATVFDVLAEQRRYLEVERAFTSALREAYEARQALRRALGEVR
jgi:cobalt-zinc-cadmium efflux system outer membrane protein